MKKGWALLGLMLLAACGGSADFKAGSYKLVDSLNNVPTTLTFDANGHVNGKVVNYLMGSYKLSAKNNIKFGDMATTMMMMLLLKLNLAMKAILTPMTKLVIVILLA